VEEITLPFIFFPMKQPPQHNNIRLPISQKVQFALMSYYYLEGDSFWQIAKSFDCDHKTAKVHSAELNDLFQSFSTPVTDPFTPFENTKTLNQTPKDLLIKHFIVYSLIKNTRRTFRCISLLMSRFTLPFVVKKSRINRLIINMNIRSRLG
jgi:hypothetical protein